MRQRFTGPISRQARRRPPGIAVIIDVYSEPAACLHMPVAAGVRSISAWAGAVTRGDSQQHSDDFVLRLDRCSNPRRLQQVPAPPRADCNGAQLGHEASPG